MLKIPTTSIYDVLVAITSDKSINLIRFDKGKAENPIEAFVRVESGETLRDESMGHGRLFSKKFVGLERDNLFLTVCRDKSTRLDDDSFGYRTIHIASPTDGLKVSEIEVLPNFSSEWVSIDLAGMPVFPKLPDEAVAWFVNEMTELHEKMARKTFLSNQMKNLKKKLDKSVSIESNGFRFYWKDPSGTRKGVLDSKGVPVKKIGSPSTNGVVLLPELAKPKFEKITDTSRIIETYQEYKEVSSKVSELSLHLRPYELGLIEGIGFVEALTVGGLTMNVKKFNSKARYDYPKDTPKKIKSKEWSMGDIKIVKGRWECDPILVPTSKTDSTVKV